MNRKRWIVSLVVVCLVLLGAGRAYAQTSAPGEPTLLTAEPVNTLGSTVGPDGALYVAEGAAGRVSRVDPQTGEVTTFASGLPQAIFPIGGPSDIAFIGDTAYVLVTMVGSDIGGSDIVGIYRVDGPNSFTVIADLGAYALAHPPTIPFDYFIPTGVHYAIEPFRGGFLVTDGHLNWVLWVSREGEITKVAEYGNLVPTGLDVWGNSILMGQAGPLPHLPQDGKIRIFRYKTPGDAKTISGVRLPVDVEFGRGRTLYVLSQGVHAGVGEGSPAEPYTGALYQVNPSGTFTPIAEGLNVPTSLEFIGNTAYIITLGGEIWVIDDVSAPPYGVSR